MTTFTSAARTDIGLVREDDQDAVLCRDHVVAVADGMGGGPGGEIASSLTLAVVDAAFSGGSLDELEGVARAANRAVFERASTTDGLDGMGTTLCAVGLVDDETLAVVNVGDSRVYRLRDGSLERLTTDHTVTADLVRSGELSEEEAADHPHHNILTRAVGVGPTVEVDGTAPSARPGDRLLLCTDGLFNEVSDDEIEDLLGKADDVAGAVDALVDLALANGGHDNIGVVVAELSTEISPAG
jgi:protein phosphatase